MWLHNRVAWHFTLNIFFTWFLFSKSCFIYVNISNKSSNSIAYYIDQCGALFTHFGTRRYLVIHRFAHVTGVTLFQRQEKRMVCNWYCTSDLHGAFQYFLFPKITLEPVISCACPLSGNMPWHVMIQQYPIHI